MYNITLTTQEARTIRSMFYHYNFSHCTTDVIVPKGTSVRWRDGIPRLSSPTWQSSLFDRLIGLGLLECIKGGLLEERTIRYCFLLTDSGARLISAMWSDDPKSAVTIDKTTFKWNLELERE